jgi:hypothetical protein
MMFECFDCESENVKEFEVTESKGGVDTTNKHVECLDCGCVWTEATFFSPVVNKDKSNEGGRKLDWNTFGDRLKLAEWAIDTWTEDELREHAISALAGKYFFDPGQFEQDLELMKADKGGA